MPGGGLGHEYEQPIARHEPARAQEGCPAVCLGRDLSERHPVDDAVTVDEGERRPEGVGGEHLDDVAGEVEPRGNLPDAIPWRRLGYRLAAEPSHLSR